jgi:MFS family permease
VEGFRVYRALLANRILTRFLLGEFVSRIGDWLYIVAIFVVIYDQSGDAAVVGAFGAVRLLPYVFLSVPAGIIADRFERRLILLVSDLFRGAIMVPLAILVEAHAPVAVIAALAILAACGSTFFYPAMGAYLPTLVEDERQLGPANSANSTLDNLGFIVGPAIGGLLLVVGSVSLAFILNALTFAFIAFILWRLPHSKGPQKGTSAPKSAEAAGAASAEVPGSGAVPGPADVPGSAAPLEAPAAPAQAPASSAAPVPAPGPAAHLKPRPLAGLAVVQLVAGFLGGGYQVITIILAVDVLKAGDQANGYLNAAIGVGGLLGGIVAGALVLRRSLGIPLVAGAVITGAGTLALGAATSLPLALVAIGVGSAGLLIVDVIVTTLFQRLVPNELLGRGVGVLMTGTTITAAAGAFLLPVLLHSVGTFEILAWSGVATVALTVLGTALMGPATSREPTAHEATIARVAKLPMFTGVPPSRLETATRRMREVPMVAGQAVVRQGEPADRFYIIVSGTLTVSQVQAPGGEPVVLRTLGPDQVFGELGLLNSSPRSATVTADTDGVLLALDGRDFLALVGASGTLRGVLSGLYVGAGTGSQ